MRARVNREQVEDLVYENTEQIDVDQLRWDYSGRGMYGRTCFGITGTPATLGEFMCMVVPKLVEEGMDVRLWTDMKVDSMGLDYIFYWENIEAPAAS